MSAARRDAQLDVMADLITGHVDVDAVIGLLRPGPPELPSVATSAETMTWRHVLVGLAAMGLPGCVQPISGTATWPGARLDKVVLTAADFPPGVNYGRIIENRAKPTAQAGSPPCCPIPGLFQRVDPGDRRLGRTGTGQCCQIRRHLRRGPDSDDRAHVAARPRSARRRADRGADSRRFDRRHRIPITTTKLPRTRADQLAYQQTMRLAGVENSVYMTFENVARMAVFGIAFPTTQVAPIAAKATLPQTFLDIADRQATARVG